MNNNFLISGIGGDIAQAICKILKSYFDDSIIVGTDITSQQSRGATWWPPQKH